MTKQFDERNMAKSRRVCEAMDRENGRRKLSERERRILEMWPKYEDGEYVWFGDEVKADPIYGGDTDTDMVSAIEFMSCTYILKGPLNKPIAQDHFEARVKRPVQRVLDADGVEIEAGDTMYGIGRTKHRFEVIDPHHIDPEVGEAFSVRCYDRDEHEECHCKPKLLAHTRPDSWRRLEEDAAKNYAAYWGCGMSTCAECPKLIDGKTPYERFGCLHCLDAMRLDLIRRAKVLAGMEVAE